ncbi:MAG: penicillin-binding protein activator [Candidatus Binatia bacterium]
MPPRRLLLAAVAALVTLPAVVHGCSGRVGMPRLPVRDRPIAVAQMEPERLPAERPPSLAPNAPGRMPPPPPRPARVMFPTIGVLLPLTGEYATFGEPALRGIRLGLGTDAGTQPPIRTIIHDTRGEAAEAGRAYQAFAADPNVIAVLGPMLAWELETVKPLAAAAQLPTVSFSQRAVPPGGPVFRFSMTREDQAAALAEYAVAERGLSRFAILQPDDSYGGELAASFRSEVTRRGGQILAEVGYDRSRVDFQTDAAKLKSRLGVSEGGEVPIDAIFIPDSADKVALIVPFLAYHDIRNVQLLGGNGWNQPEVLQRTQGQLDGAIFVDGFFLYSFLPEVKQFVDRYRDAYAKDPSILEAFGADAAKLVREHFLAGAGDRTTQLRELLASSIVRGATGISRFSADGRVDRSLFVLRFAEGSVQELERSSILPPTRNGASPAAPVSAGGFPYPTPRPGVRYLRPEFDSRQRQQ